MFPYCTGQNLSSVEQAGQMGCTSLSHRMGLADFHTARAERGNLIMRAGRAKRAARA